MTDSFLASILEDLRGPCGVTPGSRLVVGVSGGADSVALLHVLHALAPRLALALEVAHFDHAWRPESTEDAAFVRGVAGGLGWPFHVERWAQPRRGEAAARDARFDFLHRVAAATGADAIALGHHRDDQIETAFLRRARGTGLRGLRGMRPRRSSRAGVPVVRPLLDASRQALRGWLRSRGHPWREDASNHDPRLARNRLRLQQLPGLDRAAGATWRRAFLHRHRWVQDLADRREHDARRLLAQALPAAGLRGRLARGPLRARGPAPARRLAIVLWLEALGIHDLGRVHVEAIEALLENGQSGQQVALPGGTRCLLTQEALWWLPSETIEPPAYTLRRLPAPGPGAPGDPRRATRWAPSPHDALPAWGRTLVAAAALAGPLTVRRPEPGERLRLLGAPGHRKLARLFQDRRVPVHVRRIWPVVADARGAVWIPGVGAAERVRLHPGDTATVLLLERREVVSPHALAPAIAPAARLAPIADPA